MRAEVTAAVVAAPFIGSFLGVVVQRLPRREDFVRGRSRCPACGARLAARDLVPLVSWMWLRGRCRSCGGAISLFYPAIELAALAVALSAGLVFSGWLLWASCAFGWVLLTLALIDWREYLLPDPLTLPLAPLGLAVAWLSAPEDLVDRLIGAAAGFVAFVAIAALYRRGRGREGLGRGDAKLLGGLGAWVGASGLPSVILLASLLALAVAFGRRAFGDKITATDPLAFGPYLALAGWIVWLCGPLVFPW
ncbi:MAG TPA: prepilin peptidase [Stellaceae bacterium]|nr:prepilin peptidase [Stellaceae bacterium]